MNTATAGYRLIKKLKDERFDVDNLHHYHLLIQIGTRDLQVCIVDARDNRCLLIEDYILEKVKSYSELHKLLKSLFESHHLLMAGFWKKVKVSFKSNKFSLVPSALFIAEAMRDYLELNAKITDNDKILYYKHIKSNAICVFAVNKTIAQWVKTLYPNAEVGLVHQSCTLIEGALYHSKHTKTNAIYLYIDRFKLHVMTLRNGTLEYYNQFAIKQFNDYIRYIMLVVKGLKKDQATSEVVMWGYIGKQSTHYHEFYKYIKNISFGDRPDYLNFGYIFDEAQDHHYFDLYSIYLCE